MKRALNALAAFGSLFLMGMGWGTGSNSAQHTAAVQSQVAQTLAKNHEYWQRHYGLRRNPDYMV